MIQKEKKKKMVHCSFVCACVRACVSFLFLGGLVTNVLMRSFPAPLFLFCFIRVSRTFSRFQSYAIPFFSNRTNSFWEGESSLTHSSLRRMSRTVYCCRVHCLFQLYSAYFFRHCFWIILTVSRFCWDLLHFKFANGYYCYLDVILTTTIITEYNTSSGILGSKVNTVTWKKE